MSTHTSTPVTRRLVIAAALATSMAVGTVGLVAMSAAEASQPATITPDAHSAAAIHVPHDVLASVYPDLTIPPCATEDSSNCYWDAATMGNGQGRSFVELAGHLYYSR